ncbi:MAG: hypothetical protein ACLSX5_12470 [Lachnospiraceae bacterium]
MKKIKSVAALLVAVMVLLLAGCAPKFDASGYVKGELDAALKGEITDEYLKLVDATREEVEANNQEMLDEVMVQFTSVGLSDELVAKYREYMSGLLKKCKYTVGEATKTDNGYTVPVTVEPLLFGDAMQEALTSIEGDLMTWATETATSGETPSEAEIMEQTFTMLYDALNGSLETIGYGEATEHTLNVVKGEDGKYTVADEEVMALGESMIDPGSL